MFRQAGRGRAAGSIARATVSLLIANPFHNARVRGESASSHDIHRRVSENFARYFAKKRWRVRPPRDKGKEIARRSP